MAHEAAEAMPAPEIQQPTPIAAARDESAAPVSVGAAGTLVGFESATDDIDDEIREVFLEEFQEEIQNLQQTLPAWRANPAALDMLRTIRRVFHTLKGSGRLVGEIGRAHVGTPVT